jgi:hypothetical protein
LALREGDERMPMLVPKKKGKPSIADQFTP